MPGSENYSWTRADPGQQHTVTFVLRPPASASEIGERLLAGNYEVPAAGNVALAANPKDVQTVLGFVEKHGLQVVSEDASSRTIRASGTVQQLDAAFAVSLGASAGEAMHYKGDLSLPAELDGAAVAVLGLDQRAIARHN